MNNQTPRRRRKKRTDSPFQMIFAYRKQIASVVNLMDKLRDGERFDIQDTLNIVLDDIRNLVPHLIGSAIIGRADDKFTCYAKAEIEPLIMADWSNGDDQFKEVMNVVSEDKKKKSVIFQNYEKIPSLFIDDFFEKQATAVSWLCNLPDYEQLFMIFVRANKKDPWLFRVDEIIRFDELIQKTNNTSDSLSVYIKTQFSQNGKKFLNNYDPSTQILGKEKKLLIRELNELLKDTKLYDEIRFSNIDLRAKTKKILSTNPENEDLIILNRCLLEDAYPHEIEKSHKEFPFLSHEIQAIKMLSRIIGSHLNYTCTYQNLLYNIHSDLL